MRVVWKDSTPKGNFKPFNYRKYTISGHGGGWITNIPGDNNIYKNNYCAQNAIDKYLGEYKTKEGKLKQAGDKRKSYGIQIIGKKDNNSA